MLPELPQTALSKGAQLPCKASNAARIESRPEGALKGTTSTAHTSTLAHPSVARYWNRSDNAARSNNDRIMHNSTTLSTRTQDTSAAANLCTTHSPDSCRSHCHHHSQHCACNTGCHSITAQAQPARKLNSAMRLQYQSSRWLWSIKESTKPKRVARSRGMQADTPALLHSLFAHHLMPPC